MDIRDLRVFYTIVREGNISNAAKRLNIAQPPLSRQMKQLEESLGVKLFERGSRRISLTEAGNVLATRSEQILELFEGTVNEITEFSSGLGGTITIGMGSSAGASVLPKVFSQFNRLYPNVTFQAWEGNSLRILELLDSKAVEIGILRTPFLSKDYEYITLSDEPFGILMNRDKLSCGKENRTLRLIELANQPLIISRRWNPMFSDLCIKTGFKPRIICTSDSLFNEITWVKSGIGMALMPKDAESLISDSRLIFKEIIDPPIITHSAIVWLRKGKLSTACKNLLDLIRELNSSTKNT